jgi:glucokinase
MKEVVAGVDIGGTNTVSGLVDESGKVLIENNLKTTDFPEIGTYIKALAGLINKMLSTDSCYKLAGIGIGAPNANYYKGTIELAPNLSWKGIVPFADMLRKEIEVPVLMTNDANAAAMGEMIFGAAKGMKDFIVLTLGTGLGSGIVVNGQMVYGSTGFAGELGHSIIVSGGRDCGCGRKGCLETYASATGVVKTVLYLLSEKREDSILREITPAGLTSKKIAAAAVKGDRLALEAMDYTARKLALGIVNAVVFSSPEAVFLLGGLARAGEMLFDPVRKYVDEYIQPVFKGTVKILPSGVSETNAAVLGAAALIWNEKAKSG